LVFRSKITNKTPSSGGVLFIRTYFVLILNLTAKQFGLFASLRQLFVDGRVQDVGQPSDFSFMSGHSKWANIKHRKGAADLRRAALFTKLSKNITVTARNGGDPEFNFSLRTAIDKALAANMTKDKVDQAIKRGTGEIAGGIIEEVLYEGFGPGGVAVLVEALTDNRNRTSSSLKRVFSKHGGNLSGSGSVQWMFVRRGVVRARGKSGLSDDEQLTLIEAGTDDLATENGVQILTCQPDSLMQVRQAAAGISLDTFEVGLEWEAKETAEVESAIRGQIESLFEALDDDEDVSDIYSNVEL